MNTPKQFGLQLPADLIAEVEAIAATEHRPTLEMLRDAVERYVQERRLHPIASSGSLSARSEQEAAARMLERRHSHSLPTDMDIRELTTFGRA